MFFIVVFLTIPHVQLLTFFQLRFSYGPEGTGKTLMTEIIASEVGALVIHLSSTSIGNAFEDGNDATKLIHMIFTVAKEESLSPVIIYLDDCEEVFLGKSKKGGNSAINTTMKRFQKDLLIYKNQYLTKKDRVLVIGCSNKPEAGDMKLMKWKGPGGKPDKQGFFEHALYFPLPSQSWKERQHGSCKAINLSYIETHKRFTKTRGETSRPLKRG